MKYNAETTYIRTNKWWNFQSKKIKSLKLVFGVATTSCNKCCYTTWHGIKQVLDVCLRKRFLYCLYVQPKFVFWSCGDPGLKEITRKTPTNQITHVLSRRHIQQLARPRKKLHVLARKVFPTSWGALSCWKIAPRMPWRKGTTSGYSTSWTSLLLLTSPSIRSK